MTAAHLGNFFRASPFNPFILHLADGRSLAVSGADCITLGDDAQSLLVFLPGTDETELVDLALVVSIRFSETGGALAKQP